jgi:hypothetical protein
MTEKNEKWLSYEETGSVGSIKASSARSKHVEPSGLEKNPRHVGADQRGGAQDSTDAGARGRTGPTRSWLDHLVGWLV